MVEILVVLAILAIITVVSLPWFLKVMQRNALKSSAQEISITLAAARMTAVKRNQPVSVVIMSVTPPLQFRIVEAPPPTPLPTRPEKSLVLPQNAVQFVQTPNSTGGTITFGGDGRMSVPVLGALTPNATMIVEGPVNAGVRNQIRINTSSSGRIQVVTPVDWQ
jgi:Tfp pilus assembly protein FimT